MRSLARSSLLGLTLLTGACERASGKSAPAALPTFGDFQGVDSSATCAGQFDPRWPELGELIYCESQASGTGAFELRSRDRAQLVEYGRVWMIADSIARRAKRLSLEEWATRQLVANSELVCVDGDGHPRRRWVAAGYYVTVAEYRSASTVSISFSLGAPPSSSGCGYSSEKQLATHRAQPRWHSREEQQRVLEAGKSARRRQGRAAM